MSGAIVAAALLATMAFAAPAGASTLLHVTTTADASDGSCTVSKCTLRDAVEHSSAGDAVELPAGEYDLSDGDLVIRHDLGIESAGTALNTRILGDGSDRIFTVKEGTLSLEKVTLTGGKGASTLSSAEGNPGVGGAIWVDGPAALALEHVAVINSSADESGGGIDSDGSLHIAHSAIAEDSVTGAPGIGGGIDSFGTEVTLVDSTVARNKSTGDGAGILNGGGELTTVSDTIAGNESLAGEGAGVANSGTWMSINTLLSGNTDSSGEDDCSGTAPASGEQYNLSGDGTCAFHGTGDKRGAAAHLGPLSNNGGDTETMALKPESAAIDAGPSGALVSVCTIDDQRGVSRPQGPACDIGAYELEAASAPPVVATLPSIHGDQLWVTANASPGTWTNSPTTFSYRWEICDAAGNNCEDTFTETSDRILTRSFSGRTARVRVVAHNSAGASTPAVSPPTPVIDGAPEASIEQAAAGSNSISIEARIDPAGLPTTVSATLKADDGSYGTAGPVVVPSGAVQNVTVNATGLLPSTTYHVTLIAANADGSAPLPEDRCCLTRDVSTQREGEITTAEPVSITSSSAQLTGVFDPVFFIEVTSQDCAGGSGNGFENCGLQQACQEWNSRCFPYYEAYKQASFELKACETCHAETVAATGASPLGGSIPGSAGQGRDSFTGLFMDYAAFDGYATQAHLQAAKTYRYRAHYEASCRPQAYGDCDPPDSSGRERRDIYGNWRMFTTPSVAAPSSGTVSADTIFVRLGCVTAGGCAGTGAVTTRVNLPGTGPVSQGPASQGPIGARTSSAAEQKQPKPLTLGSSHFSIPAHAHRTLHIRLTKAGSAYLRKHHHALVELILTMKVHHKPVVGRSALQLR